MSKCICGWRKKLDISIIKRVYANEVARVYCQISLSVPPPPLPESAGWLVLYAALVFGILAISWLGYFFYYRYALLLLLIAGCIVV